MQKIALFSTLTFLLLSQSRIALSQQPDSVMNIYNDKFQQEKIHLHFDKSVYNKGETIWFKAYLMAGTELPYKSKNFYADWYDANGRLLKHTVSPIIAASAKGQFELPPYYAGQSIHVRAYTEWMLNFDADFLFNKDIVVYQPATAKAALKPVATTIHFFPEGGDLINGLSSKVAFKAEQSGNPVFIKGAIKTSKGELVDSFTTEHDGMGNFTIEPDVKEIYTVYWTDEYGRSDVAGLPPIKNSGAVMELQSLPGKTRVAVKRRNDATTNMRTMYLLAHMNQQVVYKVKLNLTARTGAATEIPTSNLNSGVLQVTLFDADWQPLAERVVFVNNHQYTFNAAINVAAKGMDKRQKNTIEINVPDSIASNLSISVTDAELAGDHNNIVSQFLLCDDIKGYVKDPAYYFSNTSDSTAHHLDLVMMTHGWRRFKWDDIAKGKLPVINYPRDSEYLQIKGTLAGKDLEKAKDKDFITVLLMAKDSSKQMFPLMAQPDGSFMKSNVLFFDTVKVFYQFARDKSLTDKSKISFQTNVLPATATINSTAFLSALDTAALLRQMYFAEEQRKLDKLMSEATLKEVVVETKARKILDVLDKKYTSGAFADESKYSFDIPSDQNALASLDVFRYLQNLVTGLSVNYSRNQEASVPNGAMSSTAAGNIIGAPEIIWRGEKPVLYLNEIQTDIDALMNMPMTEIAYVKVFQPPFVGGWQGGQSGAIAVYTVKAGDKKNISVEGLDSKALAGYTARKEFYSPDYSVAKNDFTADLRTTLYWNPFVFTNARNHTMKLEFYNNDISKKFRVVLEGVNADGKMTRVEKVIE